LTIPQTRLEEERIAAMGRGDPRDHGSQENLVVALAEPDSERVFFITNKPAALAGFYRPASQTGMSGRVFARDLFL
jgi:hypothetical protein